MFCLSCFSDKVIVEKKDNCRVLRCRACGYELVLKRKVEGQKYYQHELVVCKIPWRVKKAMDRLSEERGISSEELAAQILIEYFGYGS